MTENHDGNHIQLAGPAAGILKEQGHRGSLSNLAPLRIDLRGELQATS